MISSCITKKINPLNEAGAESGLRAEAYNNKNGNFQGLRFYLGELKFKVSQIDSSLSKQNIEHTIEHQQVTEQSKPKSIRIKSR